VSRVCLAFALLVPALAPAHARAQTATDPAVPDQPALTVQPPAPEPARKWSLELGGRVMVRDTLSRVDVGDSVWRHDRAIDQARVSALYERKRMRIAFEVDFAGGEAELKDTFIQLRPVDALRLQAGRFKVPVSYLGLESRWSLPSIARGLLNELEIADRALPFTGERAEGLAVQLRPDLALAPRLTASLFQSPLASGLAPIDASEDFTQDLYVRAEIEPIADLHVAASFAMVGYQAQLGQADTLRHLAMGSLELHLDARYLRAWVEGFAGQSFFYQPDGTFSGSFAAARALVGPRLRRPLPHVFRIEPYAGGCVLEPTDKQSGDAVSEALAGVTVAFSRYWRLQLEGARRIAQGAASPVADSTLVTVQLGAAFSEVIQ
jgi:hypothetical protein